MTVCGFWCRITSLIYYGAHGSTEGTYVTEAHTASCSVKYTVTFSPHHCTALIISEICAGKDITINNVKSQFPPNYK